MPKSFMYRGITCNAKRAVWPVVNCLSASGKDHRRQPRWFWCLRPLMARELGIRNVETLCISSYDHDNQRELVVVKAATTAGDGEGWLVVDDLVDTGGTAKAIRELYPRAKFITIFAKPMGEPWWMTSKSPFRRTPGLNSPGTWRWSSPADLRRSVIAAPVATSDSPAFGERTDPS